MKTEFPKYRLVNVKRNDYWLSNKYKNLFKWLNKDSLFSECFEEDSERDGDDIIIYTTWTGEGDLPKGIIYIDN